MGGSDRSARQGGPSGMADWLKPERRTDLSTPDQSLAFVFTLTKYNTEYFDYHKLFYRESF